MPVELETLVPRWPGGTCIVAGTGPSLTKTVVEQCRGYHVIAVNDAYKLMPFADVLYACDEEWWDYHKGVGTFAGERWSCHCQSMTPKLKCAEKHGLRLIRGKQAYGFSLDPSVIYFGQSSGFQAINMAILWGATKIVLVGFDMHGSHFFGAHPAPLRNTDSLWSHILVGFDKAPAPKGVQILNATPGSHLKKYPFIDLSEALCLQQCA